MKCTHSSRHSKSFPIQTQSCRYYHLLFFYILYSTFHRSTIQSNASSESKNDCRSIGSATIVTRQSNGNVPDLMFLYAANELGCLEIGLADSGPNGTKEMNERGLKIPKMLRDFCPKLVNEYEISPAGVKVVGMVISGMYIRGNG